MPPLGGVPFAGAADPLAPCFAPPPREAPPPLAPPFDAAGTSTAGTRTGPRRRLTTYCCPIVHVFVVIQ